MFDLLWNSLLVWIVPFLAILTVLVFIHEMGHYLVAKWSGVRVMAFSVGFGPEIFGWNDKSGTRWKFCWIPLGGYVRMYGDLNAASMADPNIAQMNEAERAVAFPFKPLYKRAAIVAAGPIANFLLAWVIFASVYTLQGYSFTPPVVGYVETGSAAEQAGFQIDDRLISVNGKPLERFEDLTLDEQITMGDELNFVVLRQGSEHELQAVPRRLTEYSPSCRKTTYNDLGLRAPLLNEISNVGAGSAADQAGIRVGDLITAINGQPISHFLELSTIVRELPGETVTLDVSRDGGNQQIQATLSEREICDKDGQKTKIGLLGVSPVLARETKRLGLLQSSWRGLQDMGTFVTSTFRAIGQMFVGKRGTEDLGGPIGIANMVGSAAKVGLPQLIMLTAILSLNLGLINLFPVPVLDGGHLAMYAYEAVRRKPMSPAVQDVAFRIGLFIIMSLMLFLFWNDIKNAFL